MFRRLLKWLIGERVDHRFVVLKRDPCILTSDQWRSNPENIKTAQRTLANPDLRQMLDVVRNDQIDVFDAPINEALDTRAVRHAQWQGYNLAVLTLMRLAVPVKSTEQPEPEFSSDTLVPPLPDGQFPVET